MWAQRGMQNWCSAGKPVKGGSFGSVKPKCSWYKCFRNFLVDIYTLMSGLRLNTIGPVDSRLWGSLEESICNALMAEVFALVLLRDTTPSHKSSLFCPLQAWICCCKSDL